MVALTYVILGLIAMVFTAMSYRAMSEAFPVAGSVYAYAGRGLHPSAGFLAGWAILLDYLLVPTLCYVVGAVAMRTVLPAIPQPFWVSPSWCSTLRSTCSESRLQRVRAEIFLVGELLILAVFVLLGAIAISRGVNGAHWSLRPFFNPAEFHFNIIFSALPVAVLSFLGFDAISTLAEETKGGVRVVGQATMIALCVAAVLFIAQTQILQRCLCPIKQLSQATRRRTMRFTMCRPLSAVRR